MNKDTLIVFLLTAGLAGWVLFGIAQTQLNTLQETVRAENRYNAPLHRESTSESVENMPESLKRFVDEDSHSFWDVEY